jgi:nicotinate-nucleotide adenylyltransferase
MVQAAIAGNPAFACSRIELDRPAPSYTVDTLEQLAAAGVPSDRLWFVLSAEALAGLPRWREPDRILDVARIAVVPRAGSETLDGTWVTRQFPGREDRFAFLPGPLLPISGSVIRRRAAANRSVRYLVPDAVASYIADHRLYREPA